MMNTKSKLPFCKPDFPKWNPNWHSKVVLDSSETVGTATLFELQEWCSRANGRSVLPTHISSEFHSKRQQSKAMSAISLTTGPIWISSSLEIPLPPTHKQGEHAPCWIPTLDVWRLLKMTQRLNIHWRIIIEPWATGLLSLTWQSMASCLTRHVLGSFKPTQMNFVCCIKE